MNNSTSHSETYIPSMMSFVGLQQSNTQKPLWVDWETPTNTTTTSSSHHHFFNTTTTTNNTSPTLSNLTPPPPPLPIPFPLYTPDYHQITTTTSLPPLALIKREEDHNQHNHHHQCCFGMLSGSSCQCGRIGLNLGRRTYFSAGDVAAIDRLFRRSRGVYAASHQTPRCQAEGCNADLSNAKPYHRRHKVCEFHSKSSVVIAAGLQQRFCQQCSRFHVLSEFDESKRSCRKRLADHNRRRRKAQPTPSDSSTSNNSNSMLLCDSSNNDTIEDDEQQKQNKATHYQNGSQFSSSLDSPSSSGTYFHHHNLFSSSEASHSGGTGGGASDHHNPHHPEELQNLLQLGQSMFEVDLL